MLLDILLFFEIKLRFIIVTAFKDLSFKLSEYGVQNKVQFGMQNAHKGVLFRFINNINVGSMLYLLFCKCKSMNIDWRRSKYTS